MTTETQSTSSCFNLSGERIGYTFAYCLLFAASLTGNTLIGIIAYKTRSLRNPVNYFIANMAISDLLFPIFLIPQVLVQLNTNTWLIDGPLGQALCKLSGYLVDVSSAVSIQSLVIIAVDRFRAVVFHLRSPLISSKRCRFFILATWIIAMVVFCPSLFTWKIVEQPEGLACVRRWKAAVGESSLKETFSAAMTILYLYFPLVFISILYLLIAFKMKANKIIGLQSVNVIEQRLKRERNVLKMCIAICWCSQYVGCHSASGDCCSSILQTEQYHRVAFNSLGSLPYFWGDQTVLSILTFVSFSVETIVKVLKISSVASLLVKRLIKLHLCLIPKLLP